MIVMKYTIPYGKETISFDIPKYFDVTVINQKHKQPIQNIQDVLKNELDSPVNSEQLSKIAKNKKNACIVVTDITRKCHDDIILPIVIKEIEKEINKDNITILIATGLHRKMTTQEMEEKYGKWVVENFRILDHNDEEHVFLGTTSKKTPIEISKSAVDSELLVAIGVVEPHQYAGYSGGHKTVAIGIASDKTISHTHSPLMLKDPNTKIGNINENPFQQDLIEIGKKAKLDFIVNLILNGEGEILEIKAGEPHQTHKILTQKAKKIYEIQENRQFDAVICGIGFPKDTNIYQASRAASYIAFSSRPILKKDGLIILPAKCQEGAGKGVGEKRFFDLLSTKNVEQLLEIDEFKAGEQRAFIMAHVIKDYKVAIVSSMFPQEVEKMGMIATDNMNELFDVITSKSDRPSIAIIPNSLSTLPLLK